MNPYAKAWSARLVSGGFLASMCALSGHRGHRAPFFRNFGWWCVGTTATSVREATKGAQGFSR